MKKSSIEPTNATKQKAKESTNEAKEKAIKQANATKQKAIEPTNATKQKAKESTNEAKEKAIKQANETKQKAIKPAKVAKQSPPELPYDMKKTKQREDVFRVLSESAVPLSAMDIYEKLREEITSPNEKKTNDKKTNDKKSNYKSVYAISTIYRTLQAFEKHELVEKSTLAGSDMAVYTLKAGEHTHYAICLKCHKMVPMKECPYEHIHFEEEEFTVTNHKIEVYGYCKKCGENVN